MSVDHEKLLKRTKEYIASGQISKAIGEFLELLELNPEDMDLMNYLGDIYMQANRQADAINMFKRAALEGEKNGFYSKAINIYKKMFRIAPDTDIASRLAKLYKHVDMFKEAMQIHIQLADMFTKKSLFKRALDEFIKVVELEPQNIEYKLKLADLYDKADLKDQAVKAYIEAAESQAANNNKIESYEIFERLKSMTSNPQLFLAQSRVYADQNHLNAAIKCLEHGLEANPRNIDLLEAKAKIELQLQQPIAALEVLAGIPQLPEKMLTLCEDALKMCPSEKVIQTGLKIFSDNAMEMTRRGLGGAVKNMLHNAFEANPIPEYWLLLAEIASHEGSHSEHIYSLKCALDLLAPEDQRADAIQKSLSDFGRRLLSSSSWWADSVRKKLSDLGIVLDDLIIQAPTGVQPSSPEENEYPDTQTPNEPGSSPSIPLSAADVDAMEYPPVKPAIYEDAPPLVIPAEKNLEHLDTDQPLQIQNLMEEAKNLESTSEFDLDLNINPQDSLNALDQSFGEQQDAEEICASADTDTDTDADTDALPLNSQDAYEIFSAFREEIDQQISVEDYDAHYNLAIAYKEMMLLDPAIEEFKKAMFDPKRTLECCSMLAMCEELKGDFCAAIEWLDKGIKHPGYQPIDSIGHRYDLALLLERTGRHEEAKARHQEIQTIDPGYRTHQSGSTL